jgi:hypothetical protein
MKEIEIKEAKYGIGANGQPLKWDRMKAMKLRLEGRSYNEIGVLLGVRTKTIRDGLKALGADHMEDRAVFKEHKAEILETVQMRLVKSMDDKIVDKMSGKDRIIGIGILHDKIRLERDQSTANHSVQVLSRAIRDAVKNG